VLFARAAFAISTYCFMGIAPVASAITSSGRSSSFLNRMHDLPMSSFLPADLKPATRRCLMGLSVYAHIR